MTNHTGAPMAPIADLAPNRRNPNKHSKKQVEAIARNICRLGWRVPITVSRRSGLIVRGHGRYLAAKLLGMTEAPVVFQDYESAAEEWADLIADNKLAEIATTDDEQLAALIAEMDEETRKLTGLSDLAVQDFLTEREATKDLAKFDRLISPEPKEGQNEKKPKPGAAKVLVILEGSPVQLTAKRIQEIRNQFTPLGIGMDVIER